MMRRDQIAEAAQRAYEEWMAGRIATREPFAAAVEAGIRIADAIPSRSTTALTPRQRDLMVFIERYCDEHGHAPNFDEMAAGIGLKAKSGIHRMLDELEERGIIARHRNRARAIELLRRAAQPEVRAA